MKKIISAQQIVSLLILLSIIKPGSAQIVGRLSIGDPVPPLSYSAWLKGNPQQKLQGDKIYVLEFWATWCVPCIAAMPHLSELAKQYEKEVQVISVNVMERTEKEETYASLVPGIKDFVNKNNKKMQFAVMVDDNNRSMEKQWLGKAGINAIPATIVVRNEKILWIGHPKFLDTIIAEIVASKYQLNERKTTYEQGKREEQSRQQIFRANMANIDSAISLKKYDEALELASQAAKSNPKSGYPYKQKSLQVMITNYPPSKPVWYLNAQLKEDSNTAVSLAMYIATQNNVPTELNSLATDIVVKYAAESTYSLDCLALLQSKTGNYAAAAKSQQRALELLIEARKKTPDIISEAAILNYQKKVDAYKEKQLKEQ